MFTLVGVSGTRASGPGLRTLPAAAEFLLADRPDLGGGHQEAGRERLGEFLPRMEKREEGDVNESLRSGQGVREAVPPLITTSRPA